ncbi:MAG: helix-turn-helix domain-containing protein, partial [Candidatus Methylacidiphilales bacterium]
MTPSFSQPNQSVLAGIECLQWLASSHHPISNIEMARRMNVDRNRANRLLKSLVMAGMAQQTPDRKF